MMYVLISLLVSIIFNLICFIMNNAFIHKFLTNDTLFTIMGTIMSINCASASMIHIRLV